MQADRVLARVRYGGQGRWGTALVRLAGVWLALILAFAAEWQAMARQWLDSSTYNHILLVPPIIVWLVTMRLAELRKLVPQVWAPGLALLGAAIMLWVLGSFASLNLLRQAGAVLVLPASLVTLLGTRVAIALLFPLCYMAFLVPFGDELVPTLQMITAVLTIFLVNISGIPAIVDGVFIDTPAGLFEVAEACSGVKFLVAMIALGALAANVCFRTWLRRIPFMALCVVVPILANGVRAWGTIFAAQYIGAEKAGGFDHIVYGWVFFALVIAAVLGLSWRYFDRAVDDPMINAAAIRQMALPLWLTRPVLAPPVVILLCAGLVAAGHVWARAGSNLAAPLPHRIDLPRVPGWTQVDYAPQVPWEPRAEGAEHRLLARYTDAAGRTVDVFLALYSRQAEGREASGFGEGALPQDGEWSWSSAGPPAPEAKSDVLRARGSVERLAQTLYRHGDVLTGSPLELKLAVMTDRFMLRSRPTSLLILSTEVPGETGAEAINRFRASIGPAGPWVDRIVGLR